MWCLIGYVPQNLMNNNTIETLSNSCLSAPPALVPHIPPFPSTFPRTAASCGVAKGGLVAARESWSNGRGPPVLLCHGGHNSTNRHCKILAPPNGPVNLWAEAHRFTKWPLGQAAGRRPFGDTMGTWDRRCTRGAVCVGGRWCGTWDPGQGIPWSQGSPLPFFRMVSRTGT